LDLAITRKTNHLSINIYRKPTTTDTTIHFLSNHPPEQKLAAYQFYIRRMLSLPLNQEQKNNEWLYIQHFARNNGFPHYLLLQLKCKIQHDLLHNTTISRPQPPSKEKIGQPSPTPHHRSGKSPIFSSKETSTLPSNATTPSHNSLNPPATQPPPPHMTKVVSMRSPV
jgi:hypothetical protein